MPSAKPTQPPAADLSVLVNRVDALSQKAGLGALPAGAKKLPLWKRWLGGEKPEYDGSGLRDVVKTNADYLDNVKNHLDTLSQTVIDIKEDVRVLKEAPAPRPFRRGVMLAWMFANGQHTPASAAWAAKAKGYEWAALELDDANTRAHNLSIWPAFVSEFHQRGMMAGSWFTEGGNIYQTPGDADLSIAEQEGPGDYEGIVNVINGVGGGPLPTCPLAVCTNFSTIDRPKAKVLIDAGFHCLPEAYLNENANATPDNLDRMARNLGWPTSQPVAGVYPVAGIPLPTYEQWKDWPLVDYLGEYTMV